VANSYPSAYGVKPGDDGNEVTESGFPAVIGHRGAAAHAPENTIAGLRLAAELGVGWVEFDVRLSADKRCILLHDDTLERTTDGHGPAAMKDWAALRRLDAGGWFGPKFKGERIPSLEETIEALAALGLGAVVELKPAPGQEAETGHRAAAVLAERWPGSLPPPLVSSFKPAALVAARERAPLIGRALLVGGIAADWRQRMQEVDAVMLHANQRLLDRAKAAAVGAAGVPLGAYTVNAAPRAAKLRQWGVATLFSDRPERLL
jgi:glycerophosphoryl diester phosphodiesterase